MNTTPKITSEILSLLRPGEVIHRQTFPRITERRLRKFALSLRDYNPLWHERAYAERENAFGRRFVPGSYCSIFNPMENGGLAPASAFWCALLGLPPGRSMWGGHAAYNRFHMACPIFVGDTIRIEVANKTAFEKTGKRSTLFCVETEYRMFNQNDIYVGTGTYGNMVQYTPTDAAEA